MFFAAADVPSLPARPTDAALERLSSALTPAPLDAACGYLWKLSVVPDPSLRNTTLDPLTWRREKSRFGTGSGLFHCVMEPLKIFANVGPSNLEKRC